MVKRHEGRNEFVYGLGESRGSIEKSGKVFTMEGRDALSYDWENGQFELLKIMIVRSTDYFCDGESR